jgi:hypothetical protein
VALGVHVKGGVMENRRFVFAVVGLYLLGVGLLTGMLIERIRFDEARSVLLTGLDRDAHRLRERLMAIERETAVAREGTQ